MRSFQFFGIKNCLSWDELRLRELWGLARGGDALGSITAEQQRGDALGFLEAMGAWPQRARINKLPVPRHLYDPKSIRD